MKKLLILIIASAFLYAVNYDKDCDKGNVNACYMAGLEYQKQGDIYEAAKKFSLGCQANKKKNLNSCNDAGFSYQELGEYTLATTYYEIACNNNWALSCYNLGYNYENGFGRYPNIQAAEEFYEKACYNKNGYYPACGNLAKIFMQQYKTAESKQAAEHGCKHNDGLSCHNLGVIYQAIYKDYNMAKHFYQKACNLGFKEACRL